MKSPSALYELKLARSLWCAIFSVVLKCLEGENQDHVVINTRSQ